MKRKGMLRLAAIAAERHSRFPGGETMLPGSVPCPHTSIRKRRMMYSDSIQQLARMMKEAKSIVFFGGAGVSTEYVT